MDYHNDKDEKEKMLARLCQMQKLEAIRRLAGGIAHELNNKLTSIMLRADLMTSTYKLSQPARADVESIKKTCEEIALLIRRLLAFSRRQALRVVSSDINALVRDAEKLIVNIVGKDIDFAAILAPELNNVKVDAAQIEQVIIDMAINATEAMPDKGKLIIRTENAVLDEESSRIMPESRPGEFVCLSVEDSGAGMNDDIIKDIFDPFFTTKEPGKGSGLGLAVSYGIIKQHNGWINVRSKPGHGTEFRIYLPVCRTK